MSGPIVVTGTDTDVGKTVFAAGLAGALDGEYWKPVQAGLGEETDSACVMRLSGLPAGRIHPEAYRLQTACSPHQAAAIDGVAIDAVYLAPPKAERRLIIEGAGGVLVPLARNILFADVLARWALPTVIVARTSLGTINHSLLSVEALRARGVPIVGIAFVGEANDESEATIAALANVARLGRLPRLDPLNRETLSRVFAANFAMEAFAG